MGRYGATLLRATTSTTNGIGALQQPASGMRRVRIYDVVVGSDGTAGDNSFLFQFDRASTANTGTAVTPRAHDPGDVACGTLGLENLTAEGTPGDLKILSIPLNQRATFRWIALDQKDELIIPATANHSIIAHTPVAGGTPQGTVYLGFEE